MLINDTFMFITTQQNQPKKQIELAYEAQNVNKRHFPV